MNDNKIVCLEQTEHALHLYITNLHLNNSILNQHQLDNLMTTDKSDSFFFSTLPGEGNEWKVFVRY